MVIATKENITVDVPKDAVILKFSSEYEARLFKEWIIIRGQEIFRGWLSEYRG